MRQIFALALWLGLICLSACSQFRGHPRPAFYTGYTVNSTPDAVSYKYDVQPVYIDKDFTPAALVEVRAAVAEWNFALNGFRQYRIETDQFAMEPDLVKRIVTTNQGLVILALHEDQIDEEMGDSTLGWVNRLGSPVIYIAVDRIGTRDLKHIVMHEIGHTLYVPHSTISGTLMSRFYEDQVGCIDKLTIMSVASIHEPMHWNFHNMNYCQEPQ